MAVAAGAPISPLAWELPYAVGSALKRQKNPGNSRSRVYRSWSHRRIRPQPPLPQAGQKARDMGCSGSILLPFSFFFCVVFTFSAAPRHVEFPGQGSGLSHICNLSLSCGNPHAGSGIEPASQCSQDTTDLVAPQREHLNLFYIEAFLRMFGHP